MEYFTPSPKKGSESKGKIISRRAFVLTAFKFAFFATIVSRLFYLQVVKRDDYIIRADKNRFRNWKLAPSRGVILDKNDNIIADNFQVFKIAIIPKEVKSVNKFFLSLSQIIELKQEEINFYKKQLSKNNKYQPFVLSRNLNWKEFSKLNYNIQKIEGVQPFISYERTYAFPYEFSHILGYVSAPNKQELNTMNSNLQNVPNLKIGKIGLEKKLNEDLLGSPGSATYEVNVFGKRIKQVIQEDGKNGSSIKTTLDKDIQKYAYERLKNNPGSVVVMDITGDVLCCASSPSFDSNKFTYGMDNDEYKSLLQDEKKPLVNKALTTVYPPASTIKMLVALSALENKIITKNFRHTCKGKVELYGQMYHCWKDKGHGRVDLGGAIKQSCDIYFYEVARLLGIDRLQETANNFGLGKKVFENFIEEKEGLMPSTLWKKTVLGKPWFLGETMIAGIGQGYMKFTNVQLCKMMAQFANGGYKITPSFVQSEKKELNEKIISNEEHAEFLLQTLYQATNEPGGTSYGSRINGNMKFAGKTGTAQVRRISQSERDQDVKNKDLPWKYRDHSLFVGFGPTNKPKYAITVIIDHGGSGSAVAAPIARDVMKKIFEKDLKANNV